MTDRIVDIAGDGLHLPAHRGFHLVEKDGQEVSRVALDDVRAVFLHCHGVTGAGTLVACLGERGTPIVFCGSSRQPVAATLPLEGHHAFISLVGQKSKASRNTTMHPAR